MEKSNMKGMVAVAMYVIAVFCATAFGEAAGPAAMPLFEKYGAYATFFVSGAIDPEAVRVMKRLYEAGHSVGLCGPTDANEDIEQRLAACRVSYVPASSFAYSDGGRADETDGLFRKKGFKHVRGGSATVDGAFFPAAELPSCFRVDAAVVGETCLMDVADILKCVQRCVGRKEAFALTFRSVDVDANDAHMNMEWLERILVAARGRGVAVLGFDDL